MGGDGRLLLLSVRSAVGSLRHDATVIGGFRDQHTRSSVDRRPFLLRVFAIQSGCRGCYGSPGTTTSCPDRRRSDWPGRITIRDRQQSAWGDWQISTGRRRCLCVGRGDLSRIQVFPSCAGGYINRRHTDVWYGRWCGWAIWCRAAHRQWGVVGRVLDWDGHWRVSHRRDSLLSTAKERIDREKV